MSVQLELTGVHTDLSAIARINLTDPNSDVASVAFHITGPDRRKKGPLVADRNPSTFVFEKDVILDATCLTRVDCEAILNDGTVVPGNSALLAPRYEPTNVAPGTLGNLTLTPTPLRMDVAITLGTAVLWKCYARPAAWPTLDGLSTGEIDSLMQRHEGSASGLSFSTFANPQTWYIIAVGYNDAGQPGTRKVASVQVTS